jgi:hypothetical protein
MIHHRTDLATGDCPKRAKTAAKTAAVVATTVTANNND